MAIPANDFQFLSRLVKEITGIEYKEDKSSLFEARFMPIVKKNKFNDVSDLVRALKEKRNEKILRSIADAIITNETYFFRDSRPFEIFSQTLLPLLLQQSPPKKPIRVLSLGCSSGQEPYSIAITIAENKNKNSEKDFEIVGLDVSDTVLDKARKGLYTQFEVQRGLSAFLLIKYFNKKHENWQVKDSIRSITSFEKFNATFELDKFGSFDIVFCRNTMAYFDLDIKSRILNNIAKALNHNGLLVIGEYESIYGMSDKFKPFKDSNNQIVRNIYSISHAGY